MGRETLGNFEHQILLTVLRLGGEAYSVPIVVELEERTDTGTAIIGWVCILLVMMAPALLNFLPNTSPPDVQENAAAT